MRLVNEASIPRSEKILGRATCLASDAEGDCVVVTGPKVGNLFQVRRIDPATDTKQALGIIISKAAATDCTVQFQGPMIGVYTGLTPGVIYFVGSDGRLSLTPPIVGDKLYVHSMGVATSSNEFLVAPHLATTVSGAVGAGFGWVYVSDITVPGGTATNKDWQDDVGMKVLQSATVSALSVELEIFAGFPLVRISGPDLAAPVTAELVRDAGKGFFTGIVPVTALAAPTSLLVTNITPDGGDGAVDTIQLTENPPPEILTAVFDGADYPLFVTPQNPLGILQTALKPGQTRVLNVTADKSFKAVVMVDAGATIGQEIAVTPGLSASVTVTIANRGTTLQHLPGHVRVRDTDTDALSGTFLTDTADTIDKINRVYLNSRAPVADVDDGSITYPVGQAAIKDFETALVPNTASFYDEAFYEDPTSPDQLTISNVNAFENPKSVDGTDQNLYNDSATNFRLTLYRYENGTTATASGVVIIADEKPQIDITFNPAVGRLRTGGVDFAYYNAPGDPGPVTSPQDYTVRITSDQPLIEAPTLLPDPGGNRGTFVTPFAMVGGNPMIWEATFRVDEGVPDQVGTFAFSSLQAKGLAGLVQDVINSGATYTIGGFVTRAAQVPPVQDRVSFHGPVTDLAKLVVGNIQQIALPGVVQPIGTPQTSDPGKENWVTIDALNTSPFQLLLLHIPTITANTTGNNIIEGVEETV